MAIEGVSDEEVRSILTSVSTIAVVGASPNPARPSNEVLGFLIAKGFETYPVNPGHAGGLIRGRKTTRVSRTSRLRSTWSTCSGDRLPPEGWSTKPCGSIPCPG